MTVPDAERPEVDAVPGTRRPARQAGAGTGTGAPMNTPPVTYAARKYELVCPEHGQLGVVGGAPAAAQMLRHHGCLDAYANRQRTKIHIERVTKIHKKQAEERTRDA
jgi:hypothetical protein